jgi:hypothetical protein
MQHLNYKLAILFFSLKALYTAKLQGRNRTVPFDFSAMSTVAQMS